MKKTCNVWNKRTTCLRFDKIGIHSSSTKLVTAHKHQCIIFGKFTASNSHWHTSHNLTKYLCPLRVAFINLVHTLTRIQIEYKMKLSKQNETGKLKKHLMSKTSAPTCGSLPPAPSYAMSTAPTCGSLRPAPTYAMSTAPTCGSLRPAPTYAMSTAPTCGSLPPTPTYAMSTSNNLLVF